jgi:hypothetical protein
MCVIIANDCLLVLLFRGHTRLSRRRHLLSQRRRRRRRHHDKILTLARATLRVPTCTRGRHHKLILCSPYK